MSTKLCRASACTLPATVELFGTEMLCQEHWDAMLVEAAISAPKTEWSVCPDCDGRGTDYASELEFTGSDMDDWYGDDWDAREDFVRSYLNGAYSTPCQTCGGKRVVPTAELADIQAELDQRAQWEAEMLAESMDGRYR
jgi:hypothetical protein